MWPVPQPNQLALQLLPVHLQCHHPARSAHSAIFKLPSYLAALHQWGYKWPWNLDVGRFHPVCHHIIVSAVEKWRILLNLLPHSLTFRVHAVITHTGINEVMSRRSARPRHYITESPGRSCVMSCVILDIKSTSLIFASVCFPFPFVCKIHVCVCASLCKDPSNLRLTS